MLDRKFIHPVMKIIAFNLLLLAPAGCGGGQTGVDRGGSSSLDGPSEVIAVYKANCVSCHGSELQGRIGPETNLQKAGARKSAAELTAQIENGGDTMPAFKGKLTAEEIAGLAEWLSDMK